MWRKENSCATIVRNANWGGHCRRQYKVTQKIKMEVPCPSHVVQLVRGLSQYAKI